MQLQHQCFTKTSWPLAFTSTTSTSRMESATCSTYHNYDDLPLQSSMVLVLHLHSQWARELRAHLSISQFGHIGLLDFAYDVEDPLTTNIMVQQTPAGQRQHVEIQRLTQAPQDLRDERATPLGHPARRDSNVIDSEIRQVNQDLNAQQALQEVTTAGVRRASELLGYLITHATKANSEPNNLLRRLQRTNIGWETY